MKKEALIGLIVLIALIFLVSQSDVNTDGVDQETAKVTFEVVPAAEDVTDGAGKVQFEVIDGVENE